MHVFMEGAVIPSEYTDPLYALSPVSVDQSVTDLEGLFDVLGANWSGPVCTKGLSRAMLPVSADTYPLPALREVMNIMTNLPPELRYSSVMLGGFPTNRIGEIPDDSTAYPDRGGQLLLAPLLTWEKNANFDAIAWEINGRIRDVLVEGTEKKQEAYVNYARGDESLEELYGYEPWRLEKLRRLKKEYDPYERFNFYAPIV
jgi:FAD/FMN-containing dehydrogenase